MEAMQEDRSEKCTLLGGDSDLEDERQGTAALAHRRKQGCFGLSSEGTPCPAPRRLWPCSLAVLIITVQALLIIAHLETHGRMEKLQLELNKLRGTVFRAELNKTEEKTSENAEKNDKHPIYENPRTQQKLQMMESSMARMNQYLVSLKSSQDRFKSRVEQELSHAVEMASLPSIILRVNETFAAHLISLRREMNHLNGAIVNITNRVFVLEENVPSQRQNRTFSDVKKKKNQISTFLDIPGNLDIKMTKEPDTEAFTQKQSDDEMGLLRSHPSGGHLRSVQGPSASPHPREEQEASSEVEGDPTQHDSHNDSMFSLAHS